MIGTELGSYRIQSELGSGGMGTVYLAEVVEAVAGLDPGQKVALKLVHPQLLSVGTTRRRFEQEAQAGQRIRHENVVRTFGVDSADYEGYRRHFLTMEYVEGRSLRQLLTELGTVPEALLREIGVQTAAGLGAIHAAGIVHRDIKPDNIMITDDQRVRIMDLGVAKLQEASVALTQPGQFAGSFYYAAPEQCEVREVGPAADLYALGVTLYELATGQNPFRRDNAMSVIQAHVKQEVPRVSDQNPDVSLFFSEVVATLLQKKAEDRFDSSDVLHTVLQEAEKSSWWVEREPLLRKRKELLPKIRVRRETELHGRKDDIEALHTAWAKAKKGQGNTVFIEGEPGIGKTRLVDALVQTLDPEEVHVLYGSYPPSGGLGGLSEAIIGKFGEANLAAALEPYLTVTPALVPAFAALLKHESPPAGSEPLSGDALQAVCVHLMRTLAQERPLIWVIEDLHFAAQESRDFVLALARAVESHRVLLIATARPGLPDEERAHLGRLDNFKRIALNRLGAREIVQLLANAFKSDALAEKLAGKIGLKSDGVPFFVFEMIRGLKEGNFITVQADGSYVQMQMITEIEVPSAVKDLIEGRMRGLSKDERAILDIGAVQGLEFDPGLVARVLEEKRVRVLRELADLERRSGLVRATATGFRFDQNQILEVVYGDLAPPLREEYHTLLAEAFAEQEEIGEETTGEDAVFLASHHMRGSRPGSGLPFLDPALECLETSYRNEEAIALADRALSAKGLLAGTERAEVLLKKAGRHDLRGEGDSERAALDEALALADESGEAALRSKVRAALGGHLWRGSCYEEAQSVSEQAQELAREAGDKKLEAQAARRLGNVSWVLGRLEEAKEHYERSRELGREIGYRKDEATATGNLGTVFRDLGRFEEAKEHHERGLELCREIGNRRGEAIATGNLGNVFAALGRYEEAKEHHERHRELSREIGFRQGEGVAPHNLSLALCELGAVDAGREALEQALELGREIGFGQLVAHSLWMLGDLRQTSGETEEAGRLLEEAVRDLEELGDRVGHAGALISLATHLAESGRTEEARANLEQARDLAQQSKAPGPHVLAACRLALLPGGDAAVAKSVFEEFENRLRHADKLEALHCLWQATTDHAHLEAAHRLLMYAREHAPAEYRDTMLQNVPLHRDIVAAWEEHGG